MQNEQQRRKQVTWALAVTEGTSLTPGLYERQLLEQYVCGALSLDEVIDLLERHAAAGLAAAHPASAPACNVAVGAPAPGQQ